jgi:mannosidase alpha-like ER degradation enhancer 2
MFCMDFTYKNNVLQGFCPGLSHGQKLGISFVASIDTAHQYESANKRDPTVLQSHSVVVVPNPSSDNSPSDNDNFQESSEGGSESESLHPS